MISSKVDSGLARHRTGGDCADEHNIDVRAAGAYDPHRREALDRNRAAPAASGPVHYRDDSDPRVGERVVAPGTAWVDRLAGRYAGVDSHGGGTGLGAGLARKNVSDGDGPGVAVGQVGREARGAGASERYSVPVARAHAALMKGDALTEGIGGLN